mmetsp:Transcript_48732/g.75884  ORF Transcript_48732/g.75884 Transcript_48732/m.75884 type:complete len:117 (-) Transcript_48732:884-1234(-)
MYICASKANTTMTKGCSASYLDGRKIGQEKHKRQRNTMKSTRNTKPIEGATSHYQTKLQSNGGSHTLKASFASPAHVLHLVNWHAHALNHVKRRCLMEGYTSSIMTFSLLPNDLAS